MYGDVLFFFPRKKLYFRLRVDVDFLEDLRDFLDKLPLETVADSNESELDAAVSSAQSKNLPQHFGRSE